MGISNSTSLKPLKSPDHLQLLLPYICAVTDQTLVVNSEVEVEIKSSNLSTEFIVGRGLGVFAKNFIAEGTIISKVDMDTICMMNDGLIDLTNILTAKTTQQYYQAWKDLHQSYYDINRAKSIINVRMIKDRTNQCYYQTIQDIPIGGELLRMYGFSSWPFEMLDHITNLNVGGFAKFISEYVLELEGDPFQQRIQKLNAALQKTIIKDIDLDQDFNHNLEESVIYLGDTIQFLMIFS